MSATRFVDCQYSAFFSYAADDNDCYWPNWIDDFHAELCKALPKAIDNVAVRPMYYSGYKPLLQGVLDDKLCKAVGQSFTMVIVVGDAYLSSSWCLKELEHFEAIFGDKGFRERLFIVAMSKSAIVRLQERTAWREICGDRELAYLAFHRKANKQVEDKPMIMFVADADRPGRKIFPATDFWELFLSFRDDLVAQMKTAILREAPAVGYPAERKLTPQTDDDVRVYIEADQRQDRYWQSLQRQVVAKWDEVVADDEVEPPLHLRPERLEVGNLRDGTVLQAANGVILLWADKSMTSVRDQIAAIEPHLQGPAPGIVAYLSTGLNDRPRTESISNWKVVCFRAREADGSTTVLASDAKKLSDFMHDALLHKRGT